MCQVCWLYQKEKLTKEEALTALFELAQHEKEDIEHLQRVYAEIEEA